jgi:hypothetical protein
MDKQVKQSFDHEAVNQMVQYCLEPNATILKIIPEGWEKCYITVGGIEVEIENVTIPFHSQSFCRTKFRVVYSGNVLDSSNKANYSLQVKYNNEQPQTIQPNNKHQPRQQCSKQSLGNFITSKSPPSQPQPQLALQTNPNISDVSIIQSPNNYVTPPQLIKQPIDRTRLPSFWFSPNTQQVINNEKKEKLLNLTNAPQSQPQLLIPQHKVPPQENQLTQKYQVPPQSPTTFCCIGLFIKSKK